MKWPIPTWMTETKIPPAGNEVTVPVFVDVTSFRSVKLDRGFLFFFFFLFFPFVAGEIDTIFFSPLFLCVPSSLSLASFSLFCRLLFPFLLFIYFFCSFFFCFSSPSLFLICSLCGNFFFFSGDLRDFFFFFLLNVFCEIVLVFIYACICKIVLKFGEFRAM